MNNVQITRIDAEKYVTRVLVAAQRAASDMMQMTSGDDDPVAKVIKSLHPELFDREGVNIILAAKHINDLGEFAPISVYNLAVMVEKSTPVTMLMNLFTANDNMGAPNYSSADLMPYIGRAEWSGQ